MESGCGGNTWRVRVKSCQYKFMWQGCPDGNRGRNVQVSEEFVDKVVEVKCVSNHLIMVKLQIEEYLINMISS